MIYTLFWLRDTFVKYRDGNDFIGASDIMNIASKAFSYDITDLRYLNKAWIKKEKKSRSPKKFLKACWIVLKRAVARFLNGGKAF